MVKTLGIVGGGQLGRMLTLAALPLGFKVVALDPSQNSPASQAGAKAIVGNLYDEKLLRQLAEESDYITVEIEHLDTGVLENLASQGVKINPHPSTVRLIQDKFEQKKFLHNAGIPVAPFVEVINKKTAETALEGFGGKIFIKARHGAYDGRGNKFASSNSDVAEALEEFGDRKLYIEKHVPFKKELAVMVAKSMDGEIAVYPIVETIHERSICLEVIAPADINQEEYGKANKVALEVANHLEGAGVYGIEMFLTEDGEILVNEIAPRVHNSGHYTIEACHTSQFEQHVRAVTGLPLGDASMAVPAAAMINILGERNGPVKISGLSDLLKHPRTGLHLYGKSPTKIDRKMGHITSVGDDIASARETAKNARRKISI